MNVQHFLTLEDFSPAELFSLVERAVELKTMNRRGEIYQPFTGQTLAMMFEKSSTRTRVSFEVAMAQFGGHALFLPPRDTQSGRGEPVADTARVLSSMVDAIMVRNHSHELLEELAQYSSVPVINGLTEKFHPCQLLADMQTILEHKGRLANLNVTWIGDGNNMCHSYINAARLFGFQLRIACPQAYLPHPDILAKSADCAEVTVTPQQAVEDADVIVTDVWASMGDEAEQSEREKSFAAYQVNEALMNIARPDAIFMHCLPAHRGEEVTADVIDGEQSVVWEEAENRLHAQKALLEKLMSTSKKTH